MDIKTLIRNFYQDNKPWFRFVLQWFMLAAIVGGATFLFKPSLITQIANIFKDKFGEFPAENFALARQIFYQNTIACMLALIGGIFFGITSYIIILFNGFIIGFVVTALLFAPGNLGRNILYILAGLAPHGIFELPAFWIASGLGIRLGTEYLGRSKKGSRGATFKMNLFRVAKAAPVVISLLAIAAIFEVFISGKLTRNF